MVRHLALILLVASCAVEAPADQACKEIAYAVAARSEECLDDAERANEHGRLLLEDATCNLNEQSQVVGHEDEDSTEWGYSCALSMRYVACELVEEDGDDLQARLAHDPLCLLVVTP